MIHNHNRFFGSKVPCEGGFPQPLREKTVINPLTRYVEYERRTPQDQMVVTYSERSLRFWGAEGPAHMNVQISCTLYLIFYLFKYFHKIGPQVAIKVQDVHVEGRDELQEYETARSKTSMECMWRILGFDTVYREPGVQVLPVHRKGKRAIVFNLKDGPNQNAGKSLLEKYFARPDHESTLNLRYVEYHERFREDDGRSENPIQKGVRLVTSDSRRVNVYERRSYSVCRMVEMLPSFGEVSFLRAILEYESKRGFRDVRTDVSGKVFRSYEAYARHMKYVTCDEEGAGVLRRMAARESPDRLRHMFASMILEGVIHAREAYDAHMEALVADWRTEGRNASQRVNILLCFLDDFVSRSSGNELSDFGLPQPQREDCEYDREV